MVALSCRGPMRGRQGAGGGVATTRTGNALVRSGVKYIISAQYDDIGGAPSYCAARQKVRIFFSRMLY